MLGLYRQTIHSSVLNLSPPRSLSRRRASATSSPPVAPHIKAGDFSSAPARMLFLPRLWAALLVRRVSNCTVIIPQVFGWREGPSHRSQCGGRQEKCVHSCRCASQDVMLCVFHRAVLLSEPFLLVYIQKIFPTVPMPFFYMVVQTKQKQSESLAKSFLYI